jgi:transposase
MTTLEAVRGVTGGVDTHRDVHVAAALDPLGGLLGTESFSTDKAGYKALLLARDVWRRDQDRRRRHRVLWLRAGPAPAPGGSPGHRSRSTGSTEAASDRQVRSPRRRRSRPRRTEWPSDRQPQVEGRRSRGHPCPGCRQALGRQARVKALIQMRHLGYTAPDQLRCRLKGLSVPALVAEGIKLRPTRSADPVTAATKASLSSLAHRINSLDDELAELDQRIEALLVATVPDLLDLFGVGPDTAAALVMAAGDNPERLHSEAAWAHLCGVSPIPKGSGKTSGRVRAHDGGDRQANSALWRIVMVRIAHDPETQLYFERRVKEGKTKHEVIRILKRYVAREVYRYLPRG